MSSSFPPPCALPLPLEDHTEEQQRDEQSFDAFVQHLFSDDPPEWAAETMKALRNMPRR